MPYYNCILIPLQLVSWLSTIRVAGLYEVSLQKDKSKSVETGNAFSLVMQLVRCWGGGEHNNQPLMGAAKAIDDWGMSNRTETGDDW